MTVLTGWFPDGGTRLLVLPPWAAIALGAALLLTMAALLGQAPRETRPGHRALG